MYEYTIIYKFANTRRIWIYFIHVWYEHGFFCRFPAFASATKWKREWVECLLCYGAAAAVVIATKYHYFIKYTTLEQTRDGGKYDVKIPIRLKRRSILQRLLYSVCMGYTSLHEVCLNWKWHFIENSFPAFFLNNDMYLHFQLNTHTPIHPYNFMLTSWSVIVYQDYTSSFSFRTKPIINWNNSQPRRMTIVNTNLIIKIDKIQNEDHKMIEDQSMTVSTEHHFINLSWVVSAWLYQK